MRKFPEIQPIDRMNRFIPIILTLIIIASSPFYVTGQGPILGGGAAGRVPLNVTIGVFSIMLSMTFILLIYTKLCHRRPQLVDGSSRNQLGFDLLRSSSRFSGIDKNVIDSLPYFKFSSLKGSRKGLECSVCLSKFEDIEILRLLPKCKHAFHINCIDHWLEKHSTCPLCRHRVSVNDVSLFTYSNSMMYLCNSRQDSGLELFVRREEENLGSSRIFNLGRSFRKFGNGISNDEEVLIQENNDHEENDKVVLHKHNHKIIASDFVFQNRWSDVSSSDLMFLNTEMLWSMSSDRFLAIDTKKEIENGHINKTLFEESKISAIESKASTSRIMDSSERRSVSEITVFSRFDGLRNINRIRESSMVEEKNVRHERMRQLWLPIARRTVHWFANREIRSQQSPNSNRPSEV